MSLLFDVNASIWFNYVNTFAYYLQKIKKEKEVNFFHSEATIFFKVV